MYLVNKWISENKKIAAEWIQKGPTSTKHLWELPTVSGDDLLKLIQRMPRLCKAVEYKRYLLSTSFRKCSFIVVMPPVRICNFICENKGNTLNEKVCPHFCPVLHEHLSFSPWRKDSVGMKKAAVHIPSSVINFRNQKLLRDDMSRKITSHPHFKWTVQDQYFDIIKVILWHPWCCYITLSDLSSMFYIQSSSRALGHDPPPERPLTRLTFLNSRKLLGSSASGFIPENSLVLIWATSGSNLQRCNGKCDSQALNRPAAQVRDGGGVGGADG